MGDLKLVPCWEP